MTVNIVTGSVLKGLRKLVVGLQPFASVRVKKVNVLDAILWLKSAWDNV